MVKFQDYVCTPQEAAGMETDLLKEAGLSVPEVYLERGSIRRFSEFERQRNEKPFCTLPFDHTLEAEALGGSIRYGDEKTGPRTKEYVYEGLDGLFSLPEMKLDEGRIGETIRAGAALREEGQEVLFQISGPFTILGGLVDLKYVFKGIRKNPEQTALVFGKIEEELLGLLRELKRNRIRLVSYADSAGTLNILGPSMLAWVTEHFTFDFLRKAEEIMAGEMLMLLCPKTAFALLGMGMADVKERELLEETTYAKACVRMCGQAAFVGQMCINRGSTVLKNRKIRTLRLLEAQGKEEKSSGGKQGEKKETEE